MVLGIENRLILVCSRLVIYNSTYTLPCFVETLSVPETHPFVKSSTERKEIVFSIRLA